MNDRVKFVSYDGDYPNLCRGKLVLNIDGEDVEFPDYCMCSGGGCGFYGDWESYVDYGPWTVERIPKEYENLELEITCCVNENVPHGCCGGCL